MNRVNNEIRSTYVGCNGRVNRRFDGKQLYQRVLRLVGHVARVDGKQSVPESVMLVWARGKSRWQAECTRVLRWFGDVARVDGKQSVPESVMLVWAQGKI